MFIAYPMKGHNPCENHWNSLKVKNFFISDKLRRQLLNSRLSRWGKGLQIVFDSSKTSLMNLNTNNVIRILFV